MKEPEKIGLITRREYNWLKSFEHLEPHELKKVKEFEEHQQKVFPKIEQAPVEKNTPSEKIPITKALLWKYFKAAFLIVNQKDFIETPDSIKNIAPIMLYFGNDEGFFNCENLIKTKNNPSFEKGLLVVGNYGNGKSSIMETLSFMFRELNMPMRFKSVKSHQIVSEWEAIQNPGDKSLFFEKYTCKALYIDDIKKERVASNYGKTEIIRDVLEKRYDKKLKTFLTCNYQDGDASEDLDAALFDFTRYGDHIYDRLFEMFNIIVFKGKSFRG